MRKNKILCLLLSLALLLPLLPTFAIVSNAATLTEAEFSAKLEALKKEYPDGKYWNSYNGTDAEGNSKAGNHKGMCGGHTCAVDCPCYTCGYYKNVGYQCFGFANLMAYKIFGSYATTTSEGPRGNNTKAGWRRFEYSDKSDYVYYAGDFVQVQKFGHSIFITKVEDDCVYYVDCNWSGPCKIAWDNKMTLEDMQNWTSYVLHMEGNTLTGVDAPANRLSIQYDANGGTIESTKYTINTAGLRFRESPSTSAAILENEIPKGKEMIALETKNSGGFLWAKAEYNGKIGWCAIYSESESEWYADKSGFYVDSAIIYQHRTKEPHVQTWVCGTEDDLYNATTFQLVREGYVFKGWSLSPFGGSLIDQDTKYLPESIVPSLLDGDQSMMVYAVWEETTVNNAIESIHLSATEPKRFYDIGDTVSKEGLVLTVKHKDGSYETVTEGISCYHNVFAKEGMETVAVSYQGHETAFNVQVSEEKTHNVNGYAIKAATGYLLPDASSQTIAGQGSYKNDELQVLCYENGYNLVFIPWGSDSLSKENRVLMYLPSETVGSSEDIDGPAACYSMNPTGQNNGCIVADTEVYHRPDFGQNPVMVSGRNYAVIDTLQSGTRIKVLFEMDGHYSIQTDAFTGFVPCDKVTLDEKVCGIYVNNAFSDFCLEANQGDRIDTSSLEIAACFSDNGSKIVSDYEIELPSTEKIGLHYALVSYQGFKTFVKVNVVSGTQSGDLNGDGAVTSNDAVYLLYHALIGNERYPLNQGADYNKDGAVTAEDAIYLLYYTLLGEERYPLH